MDLATKLKMYEETRELLSNPARWRKGAYAATSKRGNAIVSVDDDKAQCFCLIGGMARSLVKQHKYGRFDALYMAKSECIELSECLPNALIGYASGYRAERVIAFNDNEKTQHADVLEALDCAIKNVKLTISQQ